MTDTLDTNLPEKNVELEEAKQVAEVAEQVAAAQPADAETTEPTIEQKLTKVQVVEKMQLLLHLFFLQLLLKKLIIN